MNSPLIELADERQRARAAGDSHANLCALATVSPEGRAAVRTLVLREVSDRWLSVFCSRTSPKWEHLQGTGGFELMVCWPSIGRQFRVSGSTDSVTVIDSDEMRAPWTNRPTESKLLDHYYAHGRAQSSVVASREALLADIAKLKDGFGGRDDVPYLESAGGLRLIAESVETWRESPDRIHDRRLYRWHEDGWGCEILVP